MVRPYEFIYTVSIAKIITEDKSKIELHHCTGAH